MKRVILVIFALVLALPTIQAQQNSPAQTPPQTPPAAQQQAQRPAPAPLGPNQWRIDGNHSAANFAVRHMMVSTVRGQLGRISGTIEYDGKDVNTVKADVTIDVKGITTANEKRDAHLRSDDFFDVANHPNVTFKSKRVETGAAGRFKIVGDLTMRGTTKEVALDVDGPTAPTKTRNGIAIGATASTKVNRLEYGLKYNSMIEAGPVVSDEVTITIDLELTRPAPPGTTVSQQ
jgi:polyisoprenoid-binding protein YceI